ncbi:MAG: hypothetical protein UMR38_05435 [Candidatus Izemoplasma sp.]|nr:hypothetical protein [Candidatus Izemoplasma sp.]
MRKDLIISTLITLLIGVLIYVLTLPSILNTADQYPLLSSFIKFFLLASIGDIIGYRLQTGTWHRPPKLLAKAIVWGIIGSIIYMIFQIYSEGIRLLQVNNILPFAGSKLAFALFVSIIMNYTFAPTMMSVHRMSDTYFNLQKEGMKPSFKDAVGAIDWSAFYHMTLLRTIPLFWIPAHTITFLLPEDYRIIFAASLGIILGILLRFTDKLKQ